MSYEKEKEALLAKYAAHISDADLITLRALMGCMPGCPDTGVSCEEYCEPLRGDTCARTDAPVQPAHERGEADRSWTDGDFLDQALENAIGSILSPYAAMKIRDRAKELRMKHKERATSPQTSKEPK